MAESDNGKIITGSVFDRKPVFSRRRGMMWFCLDFQKTNLAVLF